MIMPAGKYWVGDLCYVFRDKQWDEVCNLTIVNGQCVSGIFTLKDGTQFAMYGTRYGDGTYMDTSRNWYSVDSGSIGCVLYDRIDQSGDHNGHLHDLESFIPSYHDGVIRFDEVAIDTNGWELDWVEEEYESEAEYEDTLVSVG